MNNSIQWPKAGDVLGDFILNSEIEITTARARFLATHEPSDQQAVLVCGTSELDLKLFINRLVDLVLCQFAGAPKIIDGHRGDDFCWIAHEYLECESLPAAVQRKLISQNSLHDLGQRFHLSTIVGLDIALSLERFYEAGFIHGELDPFRTALALRGDRLSGVLLETGFNDIFAPDFDRIRAHPLFSAPELLHGHPPSVRADMYACAMIMRFLMLGSPFSKDADQLLRQCQQERPAPLKQSWPELERLSNLMDAALEKDPSNRPKDWNEFLDELTLFLQEIGVPLEEEREEPPSDPFQAEDEPISAVPAKSKIRVDVPLPEPLSANRKPLAKPLNVVRAGAPLSIVGRAGKAQGPYFQAPSQCGAFCIAEVIDGQGAMQRYRASDANTEKEALLVCARVREADQEHFKAWLEKRASLQIKGIPALLGGGVDEDLGFIGEEKGKGLRLEDALPGFRETPIQLRQVLIAASAAIVATVMHECAEAGFLHGNLDPRRLGFDVEDHFTLTIYEIGALQGLNAQSAARGNPYAAPEVRDGKAWDHRADIFSFAAILFEQLTGMLSDALGDEYDGIRLKFPLPDAILRGLAADPEKRFANWIEFRDALNKSISPELRRHVLDTYELDERDSSGGDDADASGEHEPSSPNASEPASSGSVSTLEGAMQPWRPPSHPRTTPAPIALRQGGNAAPSEQAITEQAEQARPSSKKPRSLKVADPIPSTLRSEGIQKERRALVLARSTSATLMRWTPSPMKVYERSPMMVFTRSPLRVYEPAPLAPREPWGRWVEPMKNEKPFRTAFAALAVAALVLVMIGAAILSRPKPSVLAANSIEMAIPELHSVRVEPVRTAQVVEKAQGKAEEAEPQAGKDLDGVPSAPVPSAPTPNAAKKSKDLIPKPSLVNGLFDYGEKPGANPEQ